MKRSRRENKTNYSQYSYVPVHFYSKGKDGNMIFYTLNDYLVFYTLFCTEAARRHGKIISACIMPNHFHYLEITRDGAEAIRGIAVLERKFAAAYNSEYHRSGQNLFISTSGKAAKRTAKSTKSCIIYIYNNPVAGKLTRSATGYRWNTLRYGLSGHPFTGKPDRSKSRNAFRRSLSLVDDIHKSGRPINYAAMRMIFRNLTPEETDQITDYIINIYNIIDYNEVCKLFGSVQEAAKAAEIVAGSEYDIKEDYENYSLYRHMSDAMEESGYRVNCMTIEKMETAERHALARHLYERTSASSRQICKFMHINTDTYLDGKQ